MLVLTFVLSSVELVSVSGTCESKMAVALIPTSFLVSVCEEKVRSFQTSREVSGSEGSLWVFPN